MVVPRVASPTETWERWLPPAALASVTEAIERAVADEIRVTWLNVSLKDDSDIKAQSFSEFHADLADVKDREVKSAMIGVTAGETGVNLQMSAPRRDDDGGSIWLSVYGKDDTHIYGVFGSVKAAINRALASLDDDKPISDSPANVSIGSIVNSGSFAISGAGPASSASSAEGPATSASSDDAPASASASQSSQKDSAAGAWWNNPWLIAIVGGVLAALIAGIILAFLV